MPAYSYYYNAKLPICAKKASLGKEEGGEEKFARFFYHGDLKNLFDALAYKKLVESSFQYEGISTFEGKDYIRFTCKITDVITGREVIEYGEVNPATLEGEVAKKVPFAIARNIAFDRAVIRFLRVGSTPVYGSSELPRFSDKEIVEKDTKLAPPVDITGILSAVARNSSDDTGDNNLPV